MIDSIINKLADNIINPLITFLFALATLFFIYGVAEYFILNKDDSTARSEGAQHILWGVIGMFIMLSAYGIVRLIMATVGVRG
jgi:uncharacterized membrane protein YjfL (UPF0719 family)